MKSKIITKELLEEVGIDQSEYIAEMRRNQVPHLEQLATKTEIDATVMGRLAERFPSRPEYKTTARQRAKDAETDRGRAKEMVKITGANAADHVPTVLNVLKNELPQKVAELISAEEAREHVDIYGGSVQDREVQVAQAEETVRAYQAKIAELEAAISSSPSQ